MSHIKYTFFLFSSISTDILYLTNTQSIDPYKGNYDIFERTYEEITKNKIKEYEAQMQLREHAQVSVVSILPSISMETLEALYCIIARLYAIFDL